MSSDDIPGVVRQQEVLNGVRMRQRTSTTLALVMAILGSSVLPVSYAFAHTGIFAGLLISLVVALCNTYTCRLLLQAALATQTSTFEEMADAVGGPWFMRVAQASNIILLVGNLTGDMCLLADLGSKSLLSSLGDKTPTILVENHGRGIMMLLAGSVVFPLSVFKRMRALEHFATAGNVIVVMLLVILTVNAFSNNFCGVTSGEVPLYKIDVRSPDAATAFALIGFSFYLHPLMMPLLLELPSGKDGVKILSDAATVVIMAVGFGTFSSIGVMGAAAFGAQTAGDVMMNDLLPPTLSFPFSMAMLVYLASCVPPIVMSLRCYVSFIISGPRVELSWFDNGVLTLVLVAIPVALAYKDPSLAANAYALTGATGVCIVCYIIPIISHLKLLFQSEEGAEARSTGHHSGGNEGEVEQNLLESQAFTQHAPAVCFRYKRKPVSVVEWLGEVVLPAVVLFVGTAFSIIASINAL